jgi:thiol-disulfide isomerase/thioredoxin
MARPAASATVTKRCLECAEYSPSRTSCRRFAREPDDDPPSLSAGAAHDHGHWCPDCKKEAPIIGALESEHRDRGLLAVGPTRRYGYAEKGVNATPAEELADVSSMRAIRRSRPPHVHPPRRHTRQQETREVRA